MKQLLQSSGVLVCLLLLVVMTAVNTCQLDNLERQVLATQARLDELADRPVVAASTEAASPRADAREDAEIRDPDNLLVVSDRPMADYEKVAPGGTLRRMVSSDPRGMNPYIANGADVNRFNRWMNDTLGRRHLDDPATFAPMLATRVTLSDDGLTYDVTLRRGVMWHEPVVDWSSGRYDWLKGEHELTSDDFAFVFDMLQNEQVSGRISALRNYFQDLESYEIVDRYRFRVTFTRRVAGTKAILLDALFPSPRWLYMFDEDGQPFDEATWGLKVNEHWYNRKGIGVGPYRFEKWEPGVVISFERNDAYWGEVPSFERVVHTMLSDQASGFALGPVSWTSARSAEQYRTEVLDGGEPYLGQERIKFSKHDTLGYFYFGWNADTVYFSDKRVRQAMTMASIATPWSTTSSMVSERSPRARSACRTPATTRRSPSGLRPQGGGRQARGGRLGRHRRGRHPGEGDRRRAGGVRVPHADHGSSNEWTTLVDVYREALLSIGVRVAAGGGVVHHAQENGCARVRRTRRVGAGRRLISSRSAPEEADRPRRPTASAFATPRPTASPRPCGPSSTPRAREALPRVPPAGARGAALHLHLPAAEARAVLGLAQRSRVLEGRPVPRPPPLGVRRRQALRPTCCATPSEDCCWFRRPSS